LENTKPPRGVYSTGDGISGVRSPTGAAVLNKEEYENYTRHPSRPTFTKVFCDLSRTGARRILEQWWWKGKMGNPKEGCNTPKAIPRLEEFLLLASQTLKEKNNE